MSHVAFRSSYMQDVRAITERAHEVGAMVVADLYQSAGTVPVNVRELERGFRDGRHREVAVRRTRRRISVRAPRPVGQAGARGDRLDGARAAVRLRGRPDPVRRNAFPLPERDAEHSGAVRARSGYEIVNEIGVAAIRAKSVRQTKRLIELADEAGLRGRTPRDPEKRGGVVILDVPNGHEVTQGTRRAAEVLVDYRPGAGIRIAPHFYTTDEEMERDDRRSH